MAEPTIDHIDEPSDSGRGHSAAGCVGRRWLLRGGAGLAAGAVLVACGEDSGSSPSDSETSAPGGGGDTGDSGDGDTGGGDTGGGGGSLGATADVPVGGGAIFADAGVVVTQPTEGEFMAFTSVCTHQQCQVTEVTETINCPCHGSQFSIEDGSPVGGPAPSALAAMEITVDGDQISLA